MIHHGDCRVVLAGLPAASVDACVTDPPYGLEFMGKAWDKLGGGRTSKPGIGERRTEWPSNRGWNQLRCSNCGHLSHGGSPCKCDAPSFAAADDRWQQMQAWHKEWAVEVLRVLKPGAFLLAFGGTRTYHRMTCAIEDAGFEIRDCLSWLYGSGFPKSLNLPGGIGTALKPAWEPCVLARKPLTGTVAANVGQFGTGALNIDACRIGDEERTYDLTMVAGGFETTGGGLNVKSGEKTVVGRWPANVLLDEEAAAALDEQSGESVSSGGQASLGAFRGGDIYGAGRNEVTRCDPGFGDRGGASRFYYVAKPSRDERDFGTEGLAVRTAGEATDRRDGTAGLNSPRAGAGRTGGARNFHPTVKPVELMRWLVRLVTPLGGTVLDPFMGSGTTGMACRYEQRVFIGIEREADYIKIAERRIAAVAPLFGDDACA